MYEKEQKIAMPETRTRAALAINTPLVSFPVEYAFILESYSRMYGHNLQSFVFASN